MFTSITRLHDPWRRAIHQGSERNFFWNHGGEKEVGKLDKKLKKWIKKRPRYAAKLHTVDPYARMVPFRTQM